MENDIIIPHLEDDITEAEEEPPDDEIENQLDNFRSQWKQELTNQNQGEVIPESRNVESEKEQQAKFLFLQGMSAEQNGSLYEAIEYYRHAMQLVPDIERKVDFQSMRSPRDRTESESSVGSVDCDDLDPEEDLLTHFQKMQLDNSTVTCQTNLMQTNTHLSVLPVELLIYIFKWVVSTDLDMKSLENLSQVCRGFYLCARDEEIWRLACIRIWNLKVGKAKKYGGWRKMYIDRPHLQFNGCYISKCSYMRSGEKSLDGFYRPYHIVDYYRYLRFFPDGTILMMTSAEDPLVTLSKLRSPHNKIEGMLKGFYHLSSETVTGVLKRVKLYENSKSYYRYKHQQRQQNQNESEQTFQVELQMANVGGRKHVKLELQMANVGGRKHVKLVWKNYSITTHYKNSGEENIAEFELNNKNYPPLIYSRVKSYSAFSEAPLE